jgi:hypothetical protein
MLEHEKLSKFYYPKGERSLWGDGKFMGLVGHITLEKAKEYMNNQETHHAKSIIEIPTIYGWGASNYIIFINLSIC